MSSILYHLVVIAVALLGIVRGFRMRFTGQVPALIGMAFGVVCARMFCEPVQHYLYSVMPSAAASVEGDFISGNIACALIYTPAYFLFKLLTLVVGVVLRRFDTGMFDNIAGAAAGLLRYMMLLSISYNLLLCLNPRSELLRYARSDDGNVVREVMLLAPALDGCQSVETLGHLLQLEDAKKIS